MEAHVDHVRAKSHGPVQSLKDVRGITRPVGPKDLKWQDFRCGRHQVYDSGHHCAVAEVAVLRVAIDNRRRRLVYHSRRGLIKQSRAVSSYPLGWHTVHNWCAVESDVQGFISATLVPREIVAREKNALKGRVSRVHPRIKDGNDA